MTAGPCSAAGVDGRARLEQTALAGPYAQRVASLLKLIDELDAEEALFNGRITERLRDHTGYRVIQQLPGIGTTLAAVLVAEIGDVHRFASADRLCSWAGLTPRHYESDTVVRRGHVTKQGSKLVRWAVVEAIQRKTTPKITEDRALLGSAWVGGGRDESGASGGRGTVLPHPVREWPAQNGT